MATRKITITLEDDQVRAVRGLVASGKAASVSAFIKHAVGVSLQDVAGWGAMLADALQETGGPLTSREREWADRALKKANRRSKRSRSAA